VRTGTSYKTPTAFATPEYYGKHITDSSGGGGFFSFFFFPMNIKISFFSFVSFSQTILMHCIFNLGNILSGLFVICFMPLIEGIGITTLQLF